MYGVPVAHCERIFLYTRANGACEVCTIAEPEWGGFSTVLNSLDAKATSIAIRVNLITYNIQVIDNGKGISKHNFELIGQRYATSKYLSTKELEANPCIFGQRGEALASIIKICKTVKITSKTANTTETYVKTFENGNSLGISDTSERASKGTTVLIEDFMYNLPVRKTHMKINNCIEEIKNEIESISLIHPNISFSLRHDPSGEIIFQTYKSKFVYQTTTHLYGNEFTKQLRKIHFTNDKLKITGMISIVGHGHKRIQLVYVNKRHLKKSKIHSLINSLIRRSKILKNNSSPTVKHKYGVYIINLKCSRSEYDIVDFNNILIEFKNWDDILVCIEQAVKQCLEKENLMEKPKETRATDFQVGTPAWQMPIEVRTSQYDGVIRGVSVKRKPTEEISESKLSAITIEDSDNASARKEKEDNGTILQKKKPKMITKEIEEKLPIAGNLESKKDKNDNEKEIVTEIITKAQKQKKMKYYNSLKVETHTNTNAKQFCNDRDLRSLESAQSIILDMFLKSTALFKTDEELKEEFAINNKENVNKPVDVTANLNKEINNEHSFNSAKLQNHSPNLDDHGNFEQIYGKQIINPVKDNLITLSKKDISNLDDQINVITHSNQDKQINSKPESKNQTSNLMKRDNFTQISKNRIINFNNPAKPVQVSKAIQVSASKIPELNWNPDARKIDPFQHKPKCVIAPKTKHYPNSNLNLNQQMAGCEKPREQFNRKQHSNLNQILEKRHLDNEILKKQRLINGKDNNFKLNYKAKKVLTYKDIFKNNKRNDQTRHFTRKPLQEKTYIQTNYGNHKRIKHDVEKYKIPIRTRFNFRLVSSSSSTFAHRDLTSLKYNKYNYTVRRTNKFVHSSNFIKPAINDKEKRVQNQQTKFSLNRRKIQHANSMIKTWFDLEKKPKQFRQNIRDTKCFFVKTFSPKKDQTFKRNNLPYIRRGFTEVNNFRRNVLQPNNDLQMESFKPVKEKVFVPYFSVQKKIRSSFENDKKNKVNKILEPNHVDFQNSFKKPKYLPPRNIPCSKNMNEPKNLYNDITISESLDITFATILPKSEEALSAGDNQNVPEIIEILAPRNCESISEINDQNFNSNFKYPYTKHIDYSSCKNLMKSPMPLSNKEMENNYHFQEMNLRDIPQASDDEYIPFRTNPNLNEKTKHVGSNIPSHDYANMNKYSVEHKQCNPTYLQCQDTDISNRFLSDNIQNNILDIQPQQLELFNKSTENTKQLKSYVQPDYYENPRNMQERKRSLLNERLAYSGLNSQGPKKCLNTLAENTKSFNISFSPKSCILTNVSKVKNNSNSHELSNIQKAKSSFKDSVTETPVFKMGQNISSYNISSSKNVDIINKLPSGNNLPPTIKNLSLCSASNNNNEEIITNNLNMDLPMRKLNNNLYHRSNYKIKRDLNNISCSNDMSKHVSPDVIAVSSEKFNGTQLNLNNKNSEHNHIVSSANEATNNNNNKSDIDSYSVVDLISCASMKINEGPDKLNHSNINSNGGQDLNRIDVLSNNQRSPERQPHVLTSDTKLNRRSETPKTITSTLSNRNSEQNTLKFHTNNVEISAVNLSMNNTDKIKSKLVVEQILIDFESLCNSDSEKNVKNQCSNSDKNNIEVNKIQFNVAKNTSVAESVLMDLQNIISSADSENNLNIHTLHPEKNKSQMSPEYLKFSYEPVNIAKNNMDAEDNPDDFDITFDFDPDLNLSEPKHIAFEENEICKFSKNMENCLNSADSKKEDKKSNKTEKIQMKTKLKQENHHL
ncbi:Mlh1 [Carabus blaptoides fortunei]